MNKEELKEQEARVEQGRTLLRLIDGLKDDLLRLNDSHIINFYQDRVTIYVGVHKTSYNLTFNPGLYSIKTLIDTELRKELARLEDNLAKL